MALESYVNYQEVIVHCCEALCMVMETQREVILTCCLRCEAACNRHTQFSCTLHSSALSCGVHKFSKIQEPPQNSRRQKGDMKQVPWTYKY
jgi:hypothetical protein